MSAKKSRTAEATIKGFLYQFLRTLQVIVSSQDGELVVVEGPVEDIDLVDATGSVTAIQCKYHESVKRFTESRIYKPILLMYEDFCARDTNTGTTKYVLYCHFPDKSGKEAIRCDTVKNSLATESQDFKKIVSRITNPKPIQEFCKHCTIEYGPKINDLQNLIVADFVSLGFADSRADAEEIYLPSALNQIVHLATAQDDTKRTVTRNAFISSLQTLKRVTLSRWTRELSAKEKIFRRARAELMPGLSHNVRRRFIFIDGEAISDFESRSVAFIKSFVEKYSYKYLHKDPPLFVFKHTVIARDVAVQLHDKGIRCETGIVGGTAFRPDHLFRAPMTKHVRHGADHLEFRVRISSYDQGYDFWQHNPDDVILVNIEKDDAPTDGINIHRLTVQRTGDLEFAFLLRNSYDS